MKKLVVLILSIALGSISYGQNKKVPESVKQTFMEKFPDAGDVEWEYEKDENSWEADFSMNGKEMSADFNQEGQWLETEVEIDLSELPHQIETVLNEHIQSNYPSAAVEEVERIETAQGIFYEIEIIAEEMVVDQSTGEEVSTTMNSKLIYNEEGVQVENKREGEEKDDK